MSQERAETPSANGVTRPLTVPPPAAQAPLFTAAVDQAWGTIRVRGHVDRVGAELLRDALLGLQRCGHQQVTVRLGPSATLDSAARELLDTLTQRLAAEGLRLEVGDVGGGRAEFPPIEFR
jgi:hypothetical protein